jgi:hypothetical protein
VARSDHQRRNLRVEVPDADGSPNGGSSVRGCLTTTTHGCDPAADLASGRLDLRVQALLAALAERHRIRISCLRTGHSRVKGTRRVSNHTVWRGDLDLVDGHPVSRRNWAAWALVRWLDRLDGPFRPSGGRLSVAASAPALLQ